MLTTILDVLGALLLVGFAFLVWPPAALAAAGVLCLVGSWALTRSRS